MMSKYLCFLLLGFFTVGTVLGQNEEIPVENDNQFPPETPAEVVSNTNIFGDPLGTNIETTTLTLKTEEISANSLDVALPGMLATEYPGIPESESTTTDTPQERITDSETTGTSEIIDASTLQKEEVESTTVSELFTTLTQSESENTTPSLLNTEETTTLLLETTNAPQETTTNTVQEETVTTQQEQETIILSEQTTEYVPTDKPNDMGKKDEITTTSEPPTSIFEDVLKALTSSILPEEKYTTEIPVQTTDNTEMRVNRNKESATESSHIETTEKSEIDNFQQILSANIEDSVKSNIEQDTPKLHSITVETPEGELDSVKTPKGELVSVETPKGELVKQTTSTSAQSGGVDKSITAIIVVAMVAIVAAIVIKKNWNSITKRFRSTPNRAQNEYSGVKTNGAPQEEIPLQTKNDKYPV